MKTNSAFLAIVLLSSSVSTYADSGSGVGNGGDIFSHYIESSRFALKESIRRLMQSPADMTRLCEAEYYLNTDQKTECRDFLSQTMKQMLDLNQRSPITPFTLRNYPLLVDGPDGKPREVDARTQLGAGGDIELNYERVKFYSPFQMLTLLTHEFGHKVSFNGKNVEDNLPTSSFPRGRMLLDSIAITIARYAQQKGIIGSTFKLLDHFSCRITTSPGGTPMGTSGFTARNFPNLQDFSRYETGIGILPGNLDVYLIEPGFSEIHFKATIHEENSCSTTGAGDRWTRLELVRVYPSRGGQREKPDEILTETIITQWNPLCDESGAKKPMRLGYGSFQFECFYTGSTGTSSKE